MPSILSPEYLNKLQRLRPGLKNHWYYLTAAILSICNKPEEIPVLYKYVIQNPDILSAVKSQSLNSNSSLNSKISGNLSTTAQAQLQVTRKIREALFKSAALGGLPKTINSLMKLKEVTPAEFRDTEPYRPFTGPSAQPDIVHEKGSKFFQQVYGKITKRVFTQMYNAYPDLGNFAIDHVYGFLLSYSDILSPAETSFVCIACLVPQDVNPQLKGHLKGALNNGATIQEVLDVRDLSIEISKSCGVIWKEEVATIREH